VEISRVFPTARHFAVHTIGDFGDSGLEVICKLFNRNQIMDDFPGSDDGFVFFLFFFVRLPVSHPDCFVSFSNQMKPRLADQWQEKFGQPGKNLFF
jgi:hypothetical protein